MIAGTWKLLCAARAAARQGQGHTPPLAFPLFLGSVSVAVAAAANTTTGRVVTERPAVIITAGAVAAAAVVQRQRCGALGHRGERTLDKANMPLSNFQEADVFIRVCEPLCRQGL